MINRRRDLVIMDFGLARMAGGDEALTRTGSVLGTALYMAPEQAAGDIAAIGPAAAVANVPAPAAAPSGKATPAPKPDSLAAQVFAGSVTEEVTSLREDKPPARPKPERAGGKPPRFLSRAGIIAAAGAVLALLLGVIIYVATDNGQIKVEINDPRALVKVDGEEVRIEALGEPISLRAGDHSLFIRWADGEIETRSFQVRRGGEDVVRVSYKPKTAGRPEDRPAETTKAPGPLIVPADSRIVGSKRFKVFSEQLTWRQARAKCERMGGHLAVVGGEDENRILTSMISDARLDSAWLGATDEQVEGQWVWADGTAMGYDNWDRVHNQPNNWSPERASVEHWLILIVAHAGAWWDMTDVPESRWHPGFVCQWAERTAGETVSVAPPRLNQGGPAADAGGFTPLFNGKDLVGWVTHADKNLFTVEDGEILGETDGKLGKNEYLVTDRPYADFVLKASVK